MTVLGYLSTSSIVGGGCFNRLEHVKKQPLKPHQGIKLAQLLRAVRVEQAVHTTRSNSSESDSSTLIQITLDCKTNQPMVMVTAP